MNGMTLKETFELEQKRGGSIMEYLNLPFTRYDTAYLESLPDEVFFAKRFKLSKEDEEMLLKNSSLVHGRRFYRAKVLESVMTKYAAMTNPKEGEPGTKTNPLVRFGKEYVYSSKGDLVPLDRREWIVLSPCPSEEQKEMIHAVSQMPIVYGPDCPKSSPERLQRFMEYGRRRHAAATG